MQMRRFVSVSEIPNTENRFSCMEAHIMIQILVVDTAVDRESFAWYTTEQYPLIWITRNDPNQRILLSCVQCDEILTIEKACYFV